MISQLSASWCATVICGAWVLLAFSAGKRIKPSPDNAPGEKLPFFVYVSSNDGSAWSTKSEPKPHGAIRFVVVADTHTREKELAIPAGDVLIHAGDILFKNRDSQGNASIEEFNAWAKQQPPPHRILIGGNHDKVLQDLGKEYAKESFSAGHYLQDELLLLDGVLIYGSPASIPYWGELTSNDAFEGGDYSAHIAEIPDGIDILLTHGAPRHKMDVVEVTANFGDTTPGNFSVGCPQLAERVNNAKPRFHVFGHVHKPFPRVVKDGHTIYINACSVHELNPLHEDLLPPIVFDLVPTNFANSSTSSNTSTRSRSS